MAKKPSKPKDPFNLAGKSPRALADELISLIAACQDVRRYMTAKETRYAHALVRAGADMSATWKGEVPMLMLGVCMRDVRLVELMLEKGADVNAANATGTTPLICAAAFMKEDMIEALLKACPNPYLTCEGGLTAAQNAEYFQRPYRIVALVKSAEPIYAEYRAAQNDIDSVMPSKNEIFIKKIVPKKKS